MACRPVATHVVRRGVSYMGTVRSLLVGVLVLVSAGCAGLREFRTGSDYLEKRQFFLAKTALEEAAERRPKLALDPEFQEKLQMAKAGCAEEFYNRALRSADIGQLEDARRILRQLVQKFLHGVEVLNPAS